MIWTFFIVVGLGLVAVIAALVTSRLPFDPMSEAVTTANDPGLPASPHARDVDGVRFAFALRGYRMDQVDDVLDALRNRLAEQEATIAALRARPAPAAEQKPYDTAATSLVDGSGDGTAPRGR